MKNNSNILFAFIFIILIFNSCFKYEYNDELGESICAIVIENRAMHRYGGVEKYIIKDKGTINKFYMELIRLDKKVSIPTKPFEGSVLIRFYKDDGVYGEKVINQLTTGIIFKENSKYFITFSKGQFVSDIFLEQVLNYLRIERSNTMDNI